MRIMIAGFERCPQCDTMHGPVPACPKCGWLRSCAYCGVRVWIPGTGWTVSPEAHTGTVSHGICPWCAVRQYHGDPAMVDVAGSRLEIPAGVLHVRSRKISSGARYLWIGYETHTGWAGVARKSELSYA